MDGAIMQIIFLRCQFDAGDCCPSSCEESFNADCPNNPNGCFSDDITNCGDCEDCLANPDSPDFADGGDCYGLELCDDPAAYNQGLVGACVYTCEGIEVLLLTVMDKMKMVMVLLIVILKLGYLMVSVMMRVKTGELI